MALCEGQMNVSWAPAYRGLMMFLLSRRNTLGTTAFGTFGEGGLGLPLLWQSSRNPDLPQLASNAHLQVPSGLPLAFMARSALPASFSWTPPRDRRP